MLLSSDADLHNGDLAFGDRQTTVNSVDWIQLDFRRILDFDRRSGNGWFGSGRVGLMVRKLHQSCDIGGVDGRGEGVAERIKCCQRHAKGHWRKAVGLPVEHLARAEQSLTIDGIC